MILYLVARHWSSLDPLRRAMGVLAAKEYIEVSRLEIAELRNGERSPVCRLNTHFRFDSQWIKSQAFLRGPLPAVSSLFLSPSCAGSSFQKPLAPTVLAHLLMTLLTYLGSHRR
ncbi:hypothetical protein BCR35DRAFT_172637 [Leucosporidium creatinivorum]|uniref:Uncharacterized protein n=1 Tax=Leucosporidium creatinivorum TaxID=106004 RepID=A0A1Y2E952_9BASI|nr:hypothetical protein BCR35DRAFT_172637 [Leucosporidium creatinivorum]